MRVCTECADCPELGIPEDYGESPKFGGWLCSTPGDPNGTATEDDAGQSQTPNEFQMLRIHLVTKEVEEFLAVLHSLLVKRRYGFVRGALELGLWAELESQKRVIDLDSIKEAFSVFRSLDRQELQEMAGLAYLAGHEAKIVDDIPLREQAESFIEVLGLQELMEFNLGLGEEATGREAEG